MSKKVILVLSLIFTFSLTACSNGISADENVYSGTVESESFNVSAEVGGRISDINISEGSLIKAGEKIAQIDPKFYELQKAQAEGALKIAKAKQAEVPGNARDTLKDQAQGAVEQTQAAVDLAQLHIDKTSITAAVEGVVTEVFVHKGELVSSGMNIAKFRDNKNKYVKIYVEESKRNKITVGNSLDIKINDKTEKGKIIYVSPESEFTPTNVETRDEKEKTLFEVKVKFEGNSETIPGMMVDVNLQ
ncbi:hemolysin D [Clostridium polyendosporum]|uniref:Hemolysin D n=1 Tax=Clostridium polyendosporum TaxID=69208 RepID=A0A919S0U4_9CLOT|nr:biotin/lipoyl-binding protein [Clostridium polyendosporum]GIM30042.1 hemolysin D [Clostridium polyendosporum]